MDAARRNASAVFMQTTATPGQLTAGSASSAFARALRQAGPDITGPEQVVEQPAQNAAQQLQPHAQWRSYEIHRRDSTLRVRIRRLFRRAKKVLLLCAFEVSEAFGFGETFDGVAEQGARQR